MPNLDPFDFAQDDTPFGADGTAGFHPILQSQHRVFFIFCNTKIKKTAVQQEERSGCSKICHSTIPLTLLSTAPRHIMRTGVLNHLYQKWLHVLKHDLYYLRRHI